MLWFWNCLVPNRQDMPIDWWWEQKKESQISKPREMILLHCILHNVCAFTDASCYSQYHWDSFFDTEILYNFIEAIFDKKTSNLKVKDTKFKLNKVQLRAVSAFGDQDSKNSYYVHLQVQAKLYFL